MNRRFLAVAVLSLTVIGTIAWFGLKSPRENADPSKSGPSAEEKDRQRLSELAAILDRADVMLSPTDETIAAIRELGKFGVKAKPALDKLDDRLMRRYASQTVLGWLAQTTDEPAKHKEFLDALLAIDLRYLETFVSGGFDLSQRVTIRRIGTPFAPALVARLKRCKLRGEEGPITDLLVGMKGDTVPALRKTLSDSNPVARYGAACVLARMTPDEAIPAIPELSEALADADVDVRVKAALALGNIGEPAKAAIPSLWQCLDDETFIKFPGADPRRACAQAAIALVNIGDDPEKIVPRILDLLPRTGEALVKLGPKATGAATLLAEKVKAGDPAIAYVWMLHDAEHRFLPQLIEHAKSNSEKRYAALEAIERIGRPAKKAAPVLAALFKEPDPKLRWHAFLALSCVDPDSARISIPKSLSSIVDAADYWKDKPVAQVRLEFVRGVHTFNERELWDVLHTAKDHRNYGLLRALDESWPSSEDALPLLLAAWSGFQWDYQTEIGLRTHKRPICRLFTRIGPKAKDAVPVMVKELLYLRREEESQVMSALVTIGDRAALIRLRESSKDDAALAAAIERVVAKMDEK